MNPQLLLSLTLYSLNFLNLTKNNSDTRADRHFAEDKNSKLEINTPIWYKQFNQWLPGILRLLGKGYGLVIADGEKSGFPFAMSITERGPKTGLPREVTKLMQRVSSMTLEEPMRKRHHLNPYPTWAQVKNMTHQAEQTLKSTGTPMTTDKLFLAM